MGKHIPAFVERDLEITKDLYEAMLSVVEKHECRFSEIMGCWKLLEYTLLKILPCGHDVGLDNPFSSN